MARNGFKILDSDMHVFEPHDLYLKYMNPEWGDRIPRGEPRKNMARSDLLTPTASPLDHPASKRCPPRRQSRLRTKQLQERMEWLSAT